MFFRVGFLIGFLFLFVSFSRKLFLVCETLGGIMVVDVVRDWLVDDFGMGFIVVARLYCA